METKHTPGPWMAYGYEVHDRGTGHDTDGARIGNTPNAICTTHYIPAAVDQRTANARLIAAAPELLEALERLASYGNVFQYRTGTQNPYEQAIAAIAKARGTT